MSLCRFSQALQWLIGSMLMTFSFTCHAAPLTLAVADLPNTAALLIAEAEGYFASEGLSLNIIHCVNGRRCLKHLFDGEAQFSTVADTPLVLSAFSRADFAILATITGSIRSNKLAVRADRGIRSPTDLAGKRIGIVKGTTGHYFTEAFLLYYGIALKQVTFVPLEQSQLVAELTAGRIDAAGGFEPLGYNARQTMGDQVQFLPSPMIYNETVHLVASKALIGKHDAEMTKLLRAIQRGNRLIKSDPAKARAIVAARLRSDPKFIDAVWNEFQFELALDQSLVTSFAAQARWAVRQGMVTGPDMPNFLMIMHPDTLGKLSPRSVTLVK